jgi:hypothetical protein
VLAQGFLQDATRSKPPALLSDLSGCPAIAIAVMRRCAPSSAPIRRAGGRAAGRSA